MSVTVLLFEWTLAVVIEKRDRENWSSSLTHTTVTESHTHSRKHSIIIVQCMHAEGEQTEYGERMREGY